MSPKLQNANPLEVHDLKLQLRSIRQQSLEATRRGDYRLVAHLTAQAGKLNRAIMNAQGLLHLIS